MQPNPDIYPSVYGATLTAENDRVEWSYPINHLNFLDKLPFEQPWDGSNSYIGFDPTLNDCYVGAAKHTVMKLNPEDKKQATIENTTYNKKINYRLLMMESNSQLRYSPIAASYPIAWTNIVSPWFSKFTESSQAITYYNVIAESSGTASLYSAALSNFVNYESYAYAPITKINTDAILLVPQFRYITLIPTYDADGNITNFNTSISWLTYYQLKPQDKSAAGQYYDSELWENGFKDTIDAETGRITQRIIIAGARINDVYYGVNTRNGFGSLSSSLWSDKNLRPSTSQVGLNIIAEYYDEDRDAVIYEYPNGVFFSTGSDSFINPVTPWYQFYGNTMVAYTRMNPNDSGYYSSSMDNSGLMCDNNTNDLVKSNTIVLPSNFVSLDEDGSRFEIHNNVNYYYLNSDGTSSTYSSYLSSGRQYYSYTAQVPCFPLKDLIATIASFGFFFSDGYTSVTSYVLDDSTTYDNHLYRGNFDENGVSDGTWWQGDDIPDDKLDDIDYVPEVPGGGDTDEDEESGDRIPNQFRYFSGATNFITQYALTRTQLGQFGTRLWTSWADSLGDPTDMWKNFKIFIGGGDTGSIDIGTVLSFIVSLRVFPFDLSAYLGQSEPSIKIGTGNYPIEVADVWKLLSTVTYIDCGTVFVPRKFNDFRDYTNVTVSCYFPYCGTVQLNAGDVVGKTLHAWYAVDLQSGECLAVLEAYDDTGVLYNVASISGSMGALIPITATNSGQIMAQRISDAANVAGFFVGNVTRGADIFSSGMLGKKKSARRKSAMISGIAEAISGQIDDIGDMANQGISMLSRGAIECPSMSGGSGLAAFMTPDSPYIQLRYGIYSEPNNYSHSVGRVSTSSNTLGDYAGSGYIVCENVDTSGLTCHNDEKAAIAAALETGVFV